MADISAISERPAAVSGGAPPMPYEVYCPCCETLDAVRTADEATEWHGNHPTESREIDNVEYAAIKRGRKDDAHGGGPGGPARNAGTECPLCGMAVPRYLRDHLPVCPGER